jgi:hypothetical protein
MASYNPINTIATGLALGASYGYLASNPFGVASCAVYGAALCTSSESLYLVLDNVVCKNIKGISQVVSRIASGVFSVYSGLFAANFVAKACGLSIFVILSKFVAITLIVKTVLAGTLLYATAAALFVGGALITSKINFRNSHI